MAAAAAAAAAAEEKEAIRDLKGEAARTASIPRILALSAHASAEVRLAAVKQLCPCRVKEDIGAFWDRIFGTFCVFCVACCASQRNNSRLDTHPSTLQRW